MSPDGVIEPVDVSGDGVFGLMSALPRDWPDQLRLDGLEEGEEDQKTVQWTVFPTQDHRVVVAVSAPAHRDLDAAFSEQRLTVDRAVLRSAVGMVDRAMGTPLVRETMARPGRGVASHQSTAQGFDREIALQAVTRGPADVEPWCATGSSTMARAERRGPGRPRGRASPLPSRCRRCPPPTSGPDRPP